MPSHTPLTTEQLEHLASLARIALDDDERETLQRQLERIIGAVQTLAALPLDDVEPLRHAAQIETPLREDEPQRGLPREAALAAAPAHDERGFLVPHVLESGA